MHLKISAAKCRPFCSVLNKFQLMAAMFVQGSLSQLLSPTTAVTQILDCFTDSLQNFNSRPAMKTLQKIIN